MQFRDLRAQYDRYKADFDEAIQKVLLEAHFISGEDVTKLEQELADFVGVKHCVSCANGTEAMTLLLMAWAVGEGDAVFIPDFTFFATGEVVAFCGATPVFVDVDRGTFNLDPEALEHAIKRVCDEGQLTPRVIIPVDLFGLPANYPEIEAVAKKYGLRILEDGAQGFGGSINGKRSCSFGDAATTSFFPAKPLGCYGDGGAIFTNDDNLAELLGSLKVHGKGSSKYDNVRIGVNSRLDTLQAAVLRVKLKALLAHELDDVNRIASRYDKALQGLVETPMIPSGYYSSYAQYTIKLKSKVERDALQNWLKEKGIPSLVYYNKPMHAQAAFEYLGVGAEGFPVTNELCDIVLSLPMHPYMTEADVEQVVAAIVDFFNQRKKGQERHGVYL